ncbi:MAG: gliding motility-associated C-terminal domain-containing protein [Bacteroidetes bacterium]|nr:gliding motility-associated C-terminal domain-containing protein [Bacteroidota bacterium]
MKPTESVRNIFLIVGIICIPAFLFGKNFSGDEKKSESKQLASRWMNNQPVRFEENNGQMSDFEGKPVPFVLFRASARGMDVYITEKGLTYVFRKTEEEKDDEDENYSSSFRENEKVNVQWCRIDAELKDAVIKKENIVTVSPSETNLNYFLGNCPQGILRVKQYEKITIKEIYPGIDWVFYNSSSKGFKYDFIVHAGADYSRIKFIYSSAQPLKINPDGALEIPTSLGKLKEQAPVSYDKNTSIKVPTKFVSHFLEENKTEITFQVAESYNHSSDLVIDPQLFWATFFGGSDYDEGIMSATTDAGGNLFVGGYTQSSIGFPIQNSSNAYNQGIIAGGWDGFVAKFSNAGVLLWCTYFGGNGNDFGFSVAYDGTSGSLFFSGITLSASNFPLVNPGGGAYFVNSFSGGAQYGDAFVAKFNSSGGLVWSTYFGGSGEEWWGNSLAIDANSDLFIVGKTTSANFPLQNSAGAYYQPANAGGGDIFISKFSNGGALLWSTYYGGAGDEQGFAVASDGANIFVTGFTTSASPTPLPTLNPGGGAYFQGTNMGSNDAFILEFSNAGVRSWATYYGGTADDYGYSIVTDIPGNIFVSGATTSANFPLLNSAGAYYQAANAGGSDAFILKFSNTDVRQWATYYGGSGNEYSNSVFFVPSYDNLAVDKCNNVYMSFETSSTNIPTLQSCDNNYFDNSFNGGSLQPSDNFLIAFSNSGIQKWATYIGGNGNDIRGALAVDVNDNLFIAGEWDEVTNSASYPVTNPGGGAYFDGTYNGGALPYDHDAFIMKFLKSPCFCFTSAIQGQCTKMCLGGCQTINVTVSGGTPPFTYQWSPNIGNGPGTYTVCPTSTTIYTCQVMDSNGDTANSALSGACLVTIFPQYTGVSASTIQPLCFNGTGTATVTVTGATSPFTYNWNTSPAQTSQVATGLSAGNYSVVITDANGCTDTDSVTIVNPPPISLTTASVNNSCTTPGSASVSASGGSSPYSYSWSNGNTTSAISGLAAGNYSVTVQDANGCTNTASVTIVNSGNIPVVTVSPANSTICSGQSVTLTASGSGNYSWSTNQTTASIIVSPSSSSSYQVQLDSSGCTNVASAAIVVVPSPTATISPNVSVCAGQSAVLSASGGNNYLWNTGATSSSITVSPSVTATYSVVVANGNCTSAASVSVAVFPLPTPTISGNTLLCAGDISTLTASGGNFYSWSTGATSSFIVVNPSASTTYSVIASNSNNCTASSSVNVAVLSPPVALASSATICNGNSATLTASGGGNYLWSNGNTSSSIIISPTVSSNYSVIVSAGSCSDTAYSSVTVNPLPSPTIFGNTTLCLGDAATLTATGGGNYLWNNGSTSASILVSPNSSTNYSLTVTNNNCSATDSISVFVFPPPTAFLNGNATLCAGQSVVLFASGGGNYLWSTGATSSSILVAPAATTNYSVLVSIGSCNDSAFASVVVNPNPNAGVASNVTITAGQSATLTASGGGAYQWSNSSTDNPMVVNPSATTVYCVTVKDANNCSDTACAVVTVIPEPIDCSHAFGEDAFVLPNAFSPNDDGKNEKFHLLDIALLTSCVKEVYIAVYNRWGEMIFEDKQINFSWDGTFRGKPEDAAVFAYYLKAVLNNNNEVKKKGNVSLMR